MNTPDAILVNQDKHTVTYLWRRPEVTPYDSEAVRTVELLVGHVGGKIYVELNLLEVTPRITMVRCGRGYTLALSNRRTGTYSPEALWTAAEEAAARVSVSDDPRVQALFAGHPFARRDSLVPCLIDGCTTRVLPGDQCERHRLAA